MRSRLLAVIAPALALAVLTAGCAPAASPAPDRIVRPDAPASKPAAPASVQPSAPPATSVPATTPPAAGGLACVDGVVAVRGASMDLEFSGECARAEIEGEDLDIDLDDARIDTVVVRGDRIEVDLATVGSLEVTGQSADVEADAIGSLRVSGDRNSVSSEGEIGAVDVRGNDNRVRAASFGPVQQAGDRNDVAPGT